MNKVHYCNSENGIVMLCDGAFEWYEKQMHHSAKGVQIHLCVHWNWSWEVSNYENYTIPSWHQFICHLMYILRWWMNVHKWTLHPKWQVQKIDTVAIPHYEVQVFKFVLFRQMAAQTSSVAGRLVKFLQLVLLLKFIIPSPMSKLLISYRQIDGLVAS